VSATQVGHCRDCKWWDGEIANAGGYLCRRTLENGSLIWAGMYDGIFTGSEFGCVQFEAKEPK
jgi:hypothetical protein